MIKSTNIYIYIYIFVSYKAQGLQNSHPLYTEPVRRCAYWLSRFALPGTAQQNEKKTNEKASSCLGQLYPMEPGFRGDFTQADTT